MKEKLAYVFAIVFLMSLTAVAALSNMAPASAAPPVAPTPLAITGGDRPSEVVFMPQTALTANATSASRNVSAYDMSTFEIVIDQTAVNTVSVILDVSVTGTNWDVGPTLVSANAADVVEITPIQRVGQYQRLRVTTANTNPVTVTISALLE